MTSNAYTKKLPRVFAWVLTPEGIISAAPHWVHLYCGDGDPPQGKVKIRSSLGVLVGTPTGVVEANWGAYLVAENLPVSFSESVRLSVMDRFTFEATYEEVKS